MLEHATSPEFRMLAESAGVDPEKMAAAFTDPLHLFQHLTLADLTASSESCVRFQFVQRELQTALSQISSYAEGYMAGREEVTNG